jgi:hypothetical protein
LVNDSVFFRNAVALAAIQGLYAELKERDATIAELRERVTSLNRSATNSQRCAMQSLRQREAPQSRRRCTL